MGALISDIVYAFRTLRKKPAFAATAIATLALGIGSTAAIFSVVNAVLLQPLPYREPQRLVHVWHDLRNRNVTRFPWAPADFHDFRTQSTVFSEVAALTTGRIVVVNENGQGDAEQVRTGTATPNLFRMLGARMAHGTDFTDADGIPLPPPVAGAPAPQAAPQPPPKVILSDEFWQRRFGGDPSVVGTTATVGELRLDVVGVLEPGFEILFPPGINIERAPDFWVPMRINFAAGSRVNVAQRVIARLKDGVTIERAQEEVDRIAADLRQQFSIKHTAGFHLRLEPMHQDLVAEVRPVILALMGAVAFVMLIACANVANLLLVRASGRERELAVRAALGGNRMRLFRQLLVESLVLAVVAAVAGILLARFGIEVLLAVGPDNLPRLGHVRIDPTVVTFTVLAALVSAVVFGLVPALRASHPDIMDLLRRSGRTGNLSSGRWLRNAVVVMEVALAFVLLVGSGLMMRSFVALQRAQPGYDPNGVLTFFLPNLRQPDDTARQAFVRELRTRLQALPGVVAVTAAGPLPLEPRESLARYGTEEAASDPSKFGQATLHSVQPGYFEAMRTRVVEGRTLTEEDNRPDVRRMVIDRVLASKAFPGQSAVGKTLLARTAYRRAGAVRGGGRGPAPAPRDARPRRPRSDVRRRGVSGARLGEPLGGAHERRPDAAGRFGSRRGGRDQPTRRRDRRAADAGVRQPRAGADQVRADSDRRLRRDCAGAGGGRALQRAVDHRSAADRGDWRPHGVRRRAQPHLPHDGRAGVDVERGGYRDRRGGGVDVDRRHSDAAHRRQADGSRDVHVDGAGVSRHRRDRVRCSCAARRPARSDGGAERRITRCSLTGEPQRRAILGRLNRPRRERVRRQLEERDGEIVVLHRAHVAGVQRVVAPRASRWRHREMHLCVPARDADRISRAAGIAGDTIES